MLGEENLTKQRPAVFIFNHRNQVDPVIAGKLVSDNFTSVGKKELESDPIMGTIGKLMDAAFIDRDDPKAAVEELKKIEELARKGLSIMVAPEGTRLDTTEVGPFKKGPFRMAMSAGIPIVPIVIRNAEVIAARDSSTFNPGTVDVAVFPPIPVDDWTVEEPSGPNGRGAPALPRHAEGLAARQVARAGSVPPCPRRPPRRPLRRRAARQEGGQESAGEEGRRQEGAAKKAAAKKAAAKSNTTAGSSRRTGAKGRP